MAAKLIKGAKILGICAIVCTLAVLTYKSLYATATVVRVKGDKAVNVVPGSLVIQAEHTVELKSERGGRVLESNLDPGKSVKRGDLLLQIDTADLLLEIERAEADLEAAQKRIAVGSQAALDLEQAIADFAELERLHKEGATPDAELQRRKRALKSIEQRSELEKVENEARLTTLSIDLRTKKRQLEKMSIYAEYDGVIAAVYARRGDLIGANVVLAQVISDSRVVEAKISEEHFGSVRVGQRTLVRLLAQGGRAFDATVSKILPTADPVTQRHIVHLDIKAELDVLVPGTTGDASIIVAERDSPTVIPRRAVFSRKVVVIRGGRATWQPVTMGFVGIDKVEILEGVKADEFIVVEELDRFREGQRVRIRELN